MRVENTKLKNRLSEHPKGRDWRKSIYKKNRNCNRARPIFVEGFTGKLLLIHGTGDDNVHYQGAERLINELIKHNKQFKFMAYPNRAHRTSSGKNTMLHSHAMQVEFFERHLLNR